jgi:hypothetical protein
MQKLWNYAWQHAVIAVLCFTIVLTACTVDQVLSDIDLVLQTAANLEGAIGAVSPADGAALQLLTGLGIAGVNAIKTAYDNYEKNKTSSNLQNVVVAAQAIQSNLPQELAAAKIVDPMAVQKATAWVNLVTDTAVAIVNAVSPSTANISARTIGGMPTPEGLQMRWQTQVCLGDTACGALVHVHHKHGR